MPFLICMGVVVMHSEACYVSLKVLLHFFWSKVSLHSLLASSDLFFICCHIFANSLPWVLANHRIQTWNLQYNLPSHTCCFLAFCPFWWHGSDETIWMCSVRCIYLFWQTHFPCYFYLVQKEKRELVPWQTYQTIFLQNLDPQNLHVYRLNSDSQNLFLLVNENAPDWS